MSRLEMSPDMKKSVPWLVRNHMNVPDEQNATKWFKKQSNNFRNKETLREASNQLLDLHQSDRKAGKNQEIHIEKDKILNILDSSTLYVSELKINGHAVSALGKGPAIGKCLDSLLERVQSGRLPNTEADLAEAADKYIQRRAQGNSVDSLIKSVKTPAAQL